jgi:heme/copper-type cytochrome/quinol oxidase subunit 3
MSVLAASILHQAAPIETAADRARRVAVVGALSATTMLFASLVSAYLLRRSFTPWHQEDALWPAVLLTFASLASIGIEVATRASGGPRLMGLLALCLGNALYLAGAASVILTLGSKNGLTSPHAAFTALLLGVHAVHAFVGSVFSLVMVRESGRGLRGSGPALARLVTHFLTVMLFAIAFVLFLLP